MIYDEATYDLHELARYNLHIHSTYSLCAKPEMSMPKIIEMAKRAKLEIIAITDHHHHRDLDILSNNMNLKNEASDYNNGIEILYGAELSACGINKYRDPIEVNKKLDYRLYSHNHYHLDYWEQPGDKSPRGYVDHELQVLSCLLESGRVDCVAHPFIGDYIKVFQDKTLVTKEINDQELGDILKLGMDNKVAWEINTSAMIGDPEFAKRYWNIGREVGVKFHMGTDAHRLVNIDTRQYIQQLKSIFN